MTDAGWAAAHKTIWNDTSDDDKKDATLSHKYNTIHGHDTMWFGTR